MTFGQQARRIADAIRHLSATTVPADADLDQFDTTAAQLDHLADELDRCSTAGNLWPLEKVAEYHGVSLSRARHLVADNGIKRVTGYPADQAKAIPRLRQGERTDLEARRRAGAEQIGPRPCCTRDSLGAVGNCSVCGWISPPEKEVTTR